MKQEEKVFGGGSESFGKVWAIGDIVGVFLDLVDHTISKNFLQFYFHFLANMNNRFKISMAFTSSTNHSCSERNF
jgi:hypothetical protein